MARHLRDFLKDISHKKRIKSGRKSAFLFALRPLPRGSKFIMNLGETVRGTVS